MPKIRASFCIFGVPLCLLDHAFGPRVGSARPARSQDAAALAAITQANSVGWRLYGKTPRKIGFAPSVKSACSEQSSILGSQLRGVVMKRAVLYLRVSTIDQTTANQERELREVASRMGCEIVRVYKDHGMLLAGRLRETDAVIAAGSFLPNKGRLACTLLELAGDFGQDVGSGRFYFKLMGPGGGGRTSNLRRRKPADLQPFDDR